MKIPKIGSAGEILYFFKKRMKMTACKHCPQCEWIQPIQYKKCRKCGYIFDFLCEGCGRDTDGSPFCPECSKAGQYHWNRYNRYNLNGKLTKTNQKNRKKLVS